MRALPRRPPASAEDAPPCGRPRRRPAPIGRYCRCASASANGRFSANHSGNDNGNDYYHDYGDGIVYADASDNGSATVCDDDCANA